MPSCLRGLKRLLGIGGPATAEDDDDDDDDEEDPRALIGRLRDTEAMVQKKIAHLERKIEEQLAEARRHSRAHNRRAALQALARKKRHERQLSQLDGSLAALEHQREALENATVNREIVGTLRSANKAMKAMNKDVSVDQIHRLIDSLREERETSEEVANAIAGPASAAAAAGAEPDEDELMAELRQLEKEAQVDEEQQLRRRLPSAVKDPLPSRPQPQQQKSQSDMEKLQAWLA